MNGDLVAALRRVTTTGDRGPPLLAAAVVDQFSQLRAQCRSPAAVRVPPLIPAGAARPRHESIIPPTPREGRGESVAGFVKSRKPHDF